MRGYSFMPISLSGMATVKIDGMVLFAGTGKIICNSRGYALTTTDEEVNDVVDPRY